MFKTPPAPRKMVNTRSSVQRERVRHEADNRTPDGDLPHERLQDPTSSAMTTTEAKNSDVSKHPILSRTAMQASSIKSEQPPPPPPASHINDRRSLQSKKGSTSSLRAKRQQLILEAEKKKAKIRMELINKKLDVDLASLDEEYSSHDGNESRSRIEEWMERSYQELNKGLPAPENGIHTGEQCQQIGTLEAPPKPLALTPAPAAAASTDGTVQMLASALRDLAAASTSHAPNANLLSRICTPRDLPEFSGDPLDWLQFKHAFEESTELCSFTHKENMWRLRKCLRGAAKEAVSALLVSASSPETIMSTLKLRFGNPEYILSKLVQDIKKLQPMSQDYHKEIVSFSVKIQNFMEAVRAVGQDEYIRGMSVVSVILSKLPTVLLSRWTDYSFVPITEGEKPRLVILSDFLKEEAVKVSTTSNTYFVPTRSDQHKHKHSEYTQNRSQTVLMHADIQDNATSKCLFCKTSAHNKITACHKFKKALRKVRWQFVKRSGLCFKCLLSRHDRDSCPAPVCTTDDCGQAHHPLLHYPTSTEQSNEFRNTPAPAPQERQPAPAAPSPVAAAVSGAEIVSHINADDSECKVLLKVVPVRIHSANGIINSSALLDDGSTISLISDELAQRAGLRGRPEMLRVRGAWNDELSCESIVTNVNLSGMDNKIYSIRARTVKKLNLPVYGMSVVDCNRYKSLSDIKNMLCTTDLKPEILIGQDNYHLLIPSEINIGSSIEPFATLTPLGWCVHGKWHVPRSASRCAPTGAGHTTLLVSAASPESELPQPDQLLQDLHDEVRRSFALDSMGVCGKPRQNKNDLLAVATLEKTAELIDGHWWVGLPWKNEDCRMPDSYQTALKRLKSIEWKMEKDKGFSERYRDRIKHLLINNYARELTDTSTTDKTWYLPHFGIDNPNKKKLRLVFDSAAKVNGLCLNDYLHTGPDLLSSLLGIMLRFREHSIAVTGDIQDFFLRVKVQPDDQHAFRFLWRDSPTEKVRTYIMTSLIFGANCSPFVSQFIKNKNAERYESSMPEAVHAIRKSHYIDDYIDSMPDEASAIEMVRNISKVHKQGGFQIRNWTSNSVQVLNCVPQETLGTAAVKFKTDHQFEGERTLGLLWFPGTDELGFDVSLKKIPDSVIQGKEIPTKRIMLQVVMSIFDVFGFLAPFTIQGRIMLQDTWRARIGWDAVVPNGIYEKWCKWLDLLKVVDNIRIPRCYHMTARGSEAGPATAPPARPLSPRPAPSALSADHAPTTTASVSLPLCYSYLQLHVYSDASSKAMSAVAYWHWKHNNVIHVAFIASKCRVAPVKPLTIPRLELQAALLAARLADTIIKEHKLPVERRVFWCDSTTVLQWIRNNTRTYQVFEANRLGEIDELTHVHEWRYVPTKLNVADLATREDFDHAVFRSEWFSGPSYLYLDESSWPADICQPETNESNVQSVMVTNDLPIVSNLPIPDPLRFSSWLRLQRSTATVLMFIDRCKHRTCTLDCHTLERAEHLLLRQAQNEAFSEEIAAIKNGKCLQKSSKLLTLSPFLDEHGVLRAGGRIDAATDVNLEVKRPVILDGRNPIAHLIVRHYHVKAAHGNQETVVNELKQKYWLIRLRPTVKYVVSKCMLCKIRKATPRVPRMGDLPQARMAHHQRPFTFCGLDMFGPMEVTVGRRREKRYGALFTCLTVRAVHVELLCSLTTDSLIMALRRMAARRGWPRHLYSDNGTNLRGADKELQRSMLELDNEVLKAEAANNSMEFHFIPPLSPHWGGAWERLIRSVKTSLKVILKERAPREEVLSTLLAEVENIVNSRPLSHVSVEPGTPESLTPNHFLIGSTSNLPVIGTFDDSDLYLKKQWRKAQMLADMFWQRWLKEFLPQLIPRTKWNDEQKPLQVGDLVLVVDPESPRNVWPKGVVQQVFRSKDGRIRQIDVKTKTGIWRRSTARVAPISLSD